MNQNPEMTPIRDLRTLIPIYHKRTVSLWKAGPPGIPVLKTQNSPRQGKNSRKFPFGKMLDFARYNTISTEFQKFPGIPAGNFGFRDSREFPGIPEREFPVALMKSHFSPFYRPTPTVHTFVCDFDTFRQMLWRMDCWTPSQSKTVTLTLTLSHSQTQSHSVRATGNSRFENAKFPPPKKKFPKIPVR